MSATSVFIGLCLVCFATGFLLGYVVAILRRVKP